MGKTEGIKDLRGNIRSCSQEQSHVVGHVKSEFAYRHPNRDVKVGNGIYKFGVGMEKLKQIQVYIWE